MKGDLSRKLDMEQYKGVLLQQGRVVLDADWTEDSALKSQSEGAVSRPQDTRKATASTKRRRTVAKRRRTAKTPPPVKGQPYPMRLSPLALQILDYLRTHPDAEDTLQGIAEWWSLEQHIRNQIAQVQAALSELLAQGFIIQGKAPGGRARYRLNPRKPRTPAPEAFLAHGKPGCGKPGC